MRSIICIAIIIALSLLTGCAEQETAPAAEPEAATDAQEISNEDFEAGEVDVVVEDGDEAPETEAEEEPSH
jgi:PBP1b-binding outer membrane lipoprotein LpoB